MTVVVLLLIVIAGPIALVAWSFRIALRWAGRWRYAALLSIATLAGNIGFFVRGSAHDPMGHGGWGGAILVIDVASLMAAYIISDLHAHYARAPVRSSIATAPPNER